MLMADYRVTTYNNQTETSGVARYRALVADTTRNNGCKYPAGAGAANFVGVSHKATTAKGSVAVQIDGITRVEVSAAVAVGDWLKIADSVGRVCSADNVTDAATNVIGQAESAATMSGGKIDMRILPHIRTI